MESYGFSEKLLGKLESFFYIYVSENRAGMIY